MPLNRSKIGGLMLGFARSREPVENILRSEMNGQHEFYSEIKDDAMSIDLQKCSLTPVKGIPGTGPQKKGASKYLPLLHKFIDMNVPVVRLDAEYPEGVTNGYMCAMASGLKAAIKAHKLPIVVSYRRFNIYLCAAGADVPILHEDEDVLEHKEIFSNAEVLGTSIEELNLSLHIEHRLLEHGIKNVGDLIKYSPKDIGRKLGRSVKYEVVDALSSFGLELGMEIAEQ